MAQDLVNFSTFAKIMGVSSSRVGEVARQGKITYKVIGSEKLVNPIKAKKEWRANVNTPRTPCGGRATKKKKSAAKKTAANINKSTDETPADIHKKTDGPTKTKVVQQEVEIEVPTFQGMTTADAERKEKVYRARMAEIKFNEQAGKLVEVSKVKEKAFELARVTRDALQALPLKIAHEIAAETDPRKAEILLTKEINAVLLELSKGVKS